MRAGNGHPRVTLAPPFREIPVPFPTLRSDASVMLWAMGRRLGRGSIEGHWMTWVAIGRKVNSLAASALPSRA